MKIQQIAIADLKPAKYNPRKHDKALIEKLKRSIVEFGCCEPLVVNADMTVIGGHQRLLAMRELGWTEAPCYVVDLPKDKEKVLNLALNKISGEFDPEKLELVFRELEIPSLELAGFDLNELLFSTQLEKTEILPPPEKVWILIRTTPEKFAKFADFIEHLPEEGPEVFITYTGKDDGKKG